MPTPIRRSAMPAPTTRGILRLAAGLLAGYAALPAPAAARGGIAAPGPGERTAFPGVVVIKLQEGLPHAAGKSTGVAGIDAVLAAHGATAVDPLRPVDRRPRKPTHVDLSRIYLMRYADGAPPEAVAAELSRQPGVEYAEPQWTYPIDRVPNDTDYPSWQRPYLEQMHMPQGWDVARGEQGTVVVALVDGGTAWRHPDLVANVWSNPGETAGNSTDDDGNGYVDDVHGWNFANGTNDPTGLPVTPINADHGTHTAGIACAVADNSVGIAGTSWNARFMPINTSSPTNDQSIAFGFQGILYAVDNGADIVNCSWGSLGGSSTFELDLITYAWEQGTAIVAAAGNNTSTQPHYPSAYPHVLSVANVGTAGTTRDVLVTSSNRGPTIDVCAPGVNIYSTVPGGYATMTGTSMASPLTAGICALVKTRWPDYTADQVMERVRVTCDNIDAVNPSRVGQIGSGRVNAEAALTKNTPAVRITHVAFTDTDGDGIVEPGETVTLSLTATNFLAPATSLTFRLREGSSYASAVDSVVTLAALDSLESATLPPLSFAVSPSAPIQHVVGLQVAIAAASPAYTDRDRFSITVLPTFVNVDVNRIATSVTSVGKLGYSAALGGTGSDGIGFLYDHGPNLLFEGALLIGTASVKVSDAARGLSPGVQDDDFLTEPDGTPRLLPPTVLGQQTVARFTDGLAPSPLPVSVRQDSYAYVDSVHDDYILLRYMIHNTGPATLNNLRVGWYCDWDIDGSTFDTNVTGFDAARQLGYAYDTSSTGPRTYVGIRVLNAEGATSYRGIWNDQSLAPDWGVYDGFSDAEKWDCLAGGIVHPTAGPQDISNAIATGPFTVAPGDSVEVGFAFLAGVNLTALQQNSDNAALKWTHLHSGVPIQLYDLEASQDGRDVVVSWRTQREENVVAFRVYRAHEGGPLEPLGPDVAPSPERVYTYRDLDPAPGTYEYRVGEVGTDGSVLLHGTVGIHVGAAVPARTFLAPATPNPFNPSTTLRFGLAGSGAVQVVVFDARGRRVRTLLEEAAAAPGYRALTWDGRDEQGRRVSSGVYIVRLQAAGVSYTRRLTLLK